MRRWQLPDTAPLRAARGDVPQRRRRAGVPAEGHGVHHLVCDALQAVAREARAVAIAQERHDARQQLVAQRVERRGARGRLGAAAGGAGAWRDGGIIAGLHVVCVARVCMCLMEQGGRLPRCSKH